MVGSLEVLLLLAQPAIAPDCRVVHDETSPTQTRYLRVVMHYRHRDFVEAMNAFNLEPSQLQEFHERVESIPRTVLESAEPCLRAAATFHTELAVRAAAESKWALASHHADVAWRWSLSLEPPGARGRFQRDFLLLMAWVYQDLLFDAGPEPSFAEAERYFEKAVEQFPDDADVLLAAGTLYEWSGSLRLGDPAHLKEAEELYQQALRADPADAEANLRYGRVLEKRGRPGEAVEPLRRALSGTRYHIIYRAHTSLGSLLERAGKLEDAMSHYRAAIAIRPSWQVGYLALSHALHLSGQREDSRDVLDQALAIPLTEDSVYGYWSYEVGLSPRAETLLKSMRDEGTW